MGVLRFDKDGSVAVAPSRMFKAYILDSHNLFPKLFPQAYKSIVYEQGDGDVGSIKVVYLADGNKYKFAKERVEALDRDNFSCKYIVFEADYMQDTLESIVFEIKFEASGDGGSIFKTCIEFHIKGDQESKVEVELKGHVEQGLAMIKAVEAHLLANPDLYA